jgi:hypothetical protein
MPRSRLFALSGIVFVALCAIAIVGVGGSTPGPDATGDELATFYDDNAVRQGVGTFLLAASAPFVLLFGIGLATGPVRGDRGISAWGHVLVGGTILVAGAVLLASFAHFALANGGDEGISPSGLEALNALDANTWMAFNPAFGIMMLGAAGVLLSGSASRWLGWIALVLGVAAFIPLLDFFALLGTLVWIAVAGALQARRENTVSSMSGAPA